MPPRILPIDPPYSNEVGAMLAKWMPAGAQVEPLLLFRTLIQNPDLMSRMRPLGAGILGASSLNPSEREIVIDRTCARCGCEYEWGVHVASFGNTLEISSEKLAATVTASADDSIWTARESRGIRFSE
jgi:4-carboxymuconolactone decarboxylase